MRHPQVNQVQWGKTYITPSYNWVLSTEREALVPAQAGSEAQRVGGSKDRGSIPPLISLMLAEQILGGSKTSRLYRRLVEQEHLATTVSVSFNPFTQGPGQFDLYATPLSEKELPQIEAAITEEIAKLRNTPPSDDEIARAKTQLIADNVYLQDGLQSLAQVMGHLKMIGLPLDYYFTWDAKVQAVSAADISAALKMLDENYSVTGELLPKKSRE
jgi:zinc protease